MRRVAIIITAFTILMTAAAAQDTAPAATDPATPATLLAPAAAPPAPAAAAPDPADTLAAIDDAAFDARFQCPDTQGDADARIDALDRYIEWAKLRHPDWNFRKREDVRFGLLRRHGCAATLANVALSARPAFGP